MTTARVAEVLQTTNQATIENDRYNSNHSETFINGFVELKTLRTFEMAVVYNGLKGNSYINGFPFMLALSLKDPNILENGKLGCLLGRCDDINVPIAPSVCGGDQINTLHYLLSQGKVDIANEFVRLAKEKGLKIDVTKKDVKGLTVLHLAVRLGAKTLLQNLVGISDAINIQDNHGATALHYAYALADREMIAALFASGANPEIKDNKQHTPEDMLQMDFLELLELLRNRFNFEITEELKSQIKKETLRLVCQPIFPQPIVYNRVLKGKI